MYGKGQQGFLMIDVLLAVLIITVALVPIAGMFTQSMAATAGANQYTTATGIAEREIETFKEKVETEQDPALTSLNSYPYNPPDVQQTTSMVCTVRTSADVLGDKNKGDNDPYNKIIEVSVTVAWKEHGKDSEVQLITYCLRNPSYSIFAK